MNAQPTKRRKRSKDERPVRIFQVFPAASHGSCDGCAYFPRGNCSALMETTGWTCENPSRILKEITR